MTPYTLLALADGAGTLDEVVAGNEHLWPVGLVVFAAIGAFIWAARQRAKAVAKLGNATLLQRLVDTVNHPARLLSQVMVTLAVAALFGGLLRVQYGGTAEVVPASGLDVVLVVDYSKSMLAQDVYPSRSERLEAELSRFLEDADRRGDRVGVVVFAGQPRGFPITRDSRMLKLYLERADPRTENPGGTAIGRALKLALTFLIDARRPPEGTEPAEGEAEAIPPAENDQAIILLTDGEDTETRPLEVAAEAGKLGVKIYTVGIGSRSGEPVQTFDANGEPNGFARDENDDYVMTRLDEPLLEEIATKTGGRYVRVDPKEFGLDKVRDMLEDLSRSQREDEIEIHRDEAFAFFLIPGLLFLLLALGLPDRRRTS